MAQGVRCVECARVGNTKAPPAMAQCGFAVCDVRKTPGHFVALGSVRTCETFKPAPAELVAARVEWLEGAR